MRAVCFLNAISPGFTIPITLVGNSCKRKENSVFDPREKNPESETRPSRVEVERSVRTDKFPPPQDKILQNSHLFDSCFQCIQIYNCNDSLQED